MSTPTIAQHGEASPAPYVRRTDLPTDVRVSQARVLRSEWVKFFSLRSSYYSLAAAVVGMIGIGALVTGVTASHWMQLDPRERAHFDPTSSSLNGYFLAQLVIAV